MVQASRPSSTPEWNLPSKLHPQNYNPMLTCITEFLADNMMSLDSTPGKLSLFFLLVLCNTNNSSEELVVQFLSSAMERALARERISQVLKVFVAESSTQSRRPRPGILLGIRLGSLLVAWRRIAMRVDKIQGVLLERLLSRGT